MPNILPDSIIPSTGRGGNVTSNHIEYHANNHQEHPSGREERVTYTADADFDRKLHQQRKHYAHHYRTTDNEYPLFATKIHTKYEPEYPRYSQTARVPGSYDHDRPPMVPLQSFRKPFPSLSNTESLREGMYSVQPEGVPTNIPCVMKVRDAATGKLVRFRRGIETDFLKSAGVPHITRFAEDYRNEEDILHRRNGIGYSKQMDRYYRTVEMSNNYFTDKPGRWWSDPNGRTAKVQMVNTKTMNNNQHSSSNGTHSGVSAIGTNTVQARIGPSQQEANKAALKALRNRGGK